MACFAVSMALGIGTTILARKNKRLAERIKLGWLNAMLWGGVILLTIEHIAHGEVVLYPPFLTAMQNPADIQVMLQEMVTIGVGMTLAIVLAWIVIVALAANISRLAQNTVTLEK